MKNENNIIAVNTYSFNQKQVRKGKHYHICIKKFHLRDVRINKLFHITRTLSDLCYLTSFTFCNYFYRAKVTRR